MNTTLVISIIALLALSLTVLYLYDRRMLPAVARSIGFSLLRLWLAAAVLWLLSMVTAEDAVSPQGPAMGVMTVAALLLLVAWAVTTCTRRALKVFRSSMASGLPQREYLLANGSTSSEAVRPFTRRALRRTAIAALRVPVIPVMLALVLVGQTPAWSALTATLTYSCILTTSLSYVLLRTQVAVRTK